MKDEFNMAIGGMGIVICTSLSCALQKNSEFNISSLFIQTKLKIYFYHSFKKLNYLGLFYLLLNDY